MYRVFKTLYRYAKPLIIGKSYYTSVDPKLDHEACVSTEKFDYFRYGFVDLQTLHLETRSADLSQNHMAKPPFMIELVA